MSDSLNARLKILIVQTLRLKDVKPEEILDDDPLRCGACRRIVDLPPQYVEQVRQSPDGQAYLARRKQP